LRLARPAWTQGLNSGRRHDATLPHVLPRTYAHAFDKRTREAVHSLGAVREAARAAL